MTRAELEQTIATVVRKTMREELREILVEAVTIASKPDEEYRPVTVNKRKAPETVESQSFTGLDELLEETARGMTKQDYRNIYSEPLKQVVSFTPEEDSVDDELPAFVKNAASIFEASLKHKNGI